MGLYFQKWEWLVTAKLHRLVGMAGSTASVEGRHILYVFVPSKLN
jgi:hypothetical protein